MYERRLLQSGHLRLADADLACNLGLGFSTKKPEC